MQTFDEAVGALGTPLSHVVVDGWNGDKLHVARWRHRDFHARRSAEDAVRIVMSLAFENMLSFRTADFSIELASVPGDVRIFPPTASVETRVEGQSDVLQIFVDADAVAPFGSRSALGPIVNIASEDLRASAIALFFSTRPRTATRPDRAAAMLRETLRHPFAAAMQPQAESARGGLQPAVLRRIDAMIDAGSARLRTRGPPSATLPRPCG